MSINTEALKQFARLQIPYDDLIHSLNGERFNNGSSTIDFSAQDLKSVLNVATKIEKDELATWINFVMFSGFYDFSEPDSELIAQVLNDIEDGEDLSKDEYSKVIEKVKADLESGVYPRE